MSDIVIKHFDGKEVRFRQEGEKLLMSMKEIGDVLGYQYPRQSVDKIYREHRDEFDNDCTQVVVSATGYPGEPPQRERLFTLDGLILLCMFSEQPIAKKVRRWLRRIGREVAEHGHYVTPQLLNKILGRMDEKYSLVVQTFEGMAKVMDAYSKRMDLLEERFDATYVPAQKDNSFWPTPTQLLKQCLNHMRIPKRFNCGGAFDWYASERHSLVRGGLLSVRDRRTMKKMPDVVIEDCPENRQFMKETFSVYMQTRWRQGELKLVPSTKTEPSEVSQ